MTVPQIDPSVIDEESADATAALKALKQVDPVALFYPKGCSLDKMTRHLLVSEVQDALLKAGVRRDEEVFNVHLEQEVAYAVVREVACKGCEMNKCRHWVNPHK